MWSPVQNKTIDPPPLLVCIHGGGYTHRYFDIPGVSLIEAGNLAGFHVFSLDRPGHGGSQQLQKGSNLILGNGEIIIDAINELIKLYATDVTNVVLIGHSMGGACAVSAGSMQPNWLSGIAISGVGYNPVQMKLLPLFHFFHRIKLPKFILIRAMFGPANTYDKKMAYDQINLSSCKILKQEAIEMTKWWPHNLHSITQKINVPVDSAIAQYESLWVVNSESVKNFSDAFINSEHVSAYIVADVGHCIEHHIKGADFHSRQLAFATKCYTDRVLP